MRLWLAAVISLAGVLSLVAAKSTAAQPLPIRTYSVADGIAHDRVKRIVADSRGLLWFCTPEGVSRFDGTRFITYKQQQGLPFDSVNDLIETRAGDYWLATNGAGVARVSGGTQFVAHATGTSAASNRVDVLYEIVQAASGQAPMPVSSSSTTATPASTRCRWRQSPRSEHRPGSIDSSKWSACERVLRQTCAMTSAQASRGSPYRPSRCLRAHRATSPAPEAGLWIGHNDEMSVSADTVRLQLDYSAWATQRLLDVAATLPPEKLTRDFQTSDKCVLDTLVHIYAADRIWLSRVLAEPRATFVDPEDRDLALLQTEWPALHQRWKLWMRDFSDADVAEMISFEDMRGNPYTKPVWQVVLHVVNHGTHHRGQVSGFLRAMRHTPPPLDLMEYYMTL